MTELNVLAAGAATAGKLCAICQTQIIAGERIVGCPHCDLAFHEECWTENRGCAQYGCKGAPETEKAETAAPAVNVWGEEKPCPSCRRLIRAQALKCRFCGASFGTAEIITAAEYATREYEGREYLAARNKAVALFLCSITGLLSPIAFILQSILIFGGRFAGVEYKRLPPAIRLLCVTGLALSGLLSLMFILFLAFD